MEKKQWRKVSEESFVEEYKGFLIFAVYESWVFKLFLIFIFIIIF